MAGGGRRTGATWYAPSGTAEGAVPTVNAEGVVEWPVGSGGFVPTFIASGETFTVPADRQALFAETIDNEGILDVVGSLIMVD